MNGGKTVVTYIKKLELRKLRAVQQFHGVGLNRGGREGDEEGEDEG